ncbi:hypothetical protein [Piscinibacter sp. XHJ-5]|uniref:hypothetical protein n=1 Tax=Piscinibacter sp. XHJ-5 TaxID=3037797 RepID=UPI002452F232|nr:hypothetical protein [Piscinibacter sp. XHJ-5]
MVVWRKALVAVAVAWMGVCGALPVQAFERTAASAGEPMSADARFALQWILATRDNHGMPFAVVDKKDARVFIYDARGHLVGATRALLGMARGDHSVPGIGDVPPARIPVADRTTPAGRFVTEPGENHVGEHVVWVDYAAALAIHRVRPDAARDARLQRLASGRPDAQRVSAGCIVVPVDFYDDVVRPTLGQRRGVVYVLPEMRPVREMFGKVGDL